MDKLIEAVNEYKEQISRNFDMEDGRKRWEVYGVTRKVAQAACNYGGYIVTGTRHYCPIMWLQINAIGHDVLIEFAGGRKNIVQGFTDQYGNFLTREEAYMVAKDAGQLLERHMWGETLYSESYI